MAGENEFRVSADASRCGGLYAKPVVIGLLCALNSQQSMLVLEGLAEEPVWGELVSAPKSLLTGKRTGNLAVFGLNLGF